MLVNEEEADRIRTCPLFQNLTEDALSGALDFFHAKLKTVRKGDVLKQPGDRMNFFGLLLKGSMEVAIDDQDGYHLVMAQVEKGQTFGESLCYLGENNPVSITAPCDSRYLRLDLDSLKKGDLRDPLYAMLEARFITILAKRTLQMNQRIQILSKLTIREKLLTYLRLKTGESGVSSVKVPMSREGLADWLGCNRSALSRELSAMQKEGILTVEGNRFTFGIVAQGE